MVIVTVLLRIMAIGLFVVGSFGVLLIVFGSRAQGLAAHQAAAVAVVGLVYTVIAGGSGWGLWLLAKKLSRKPHTKL